MSKTDVSEISKTKSDKIGKWSDLLQDCKGRKSRHD